MAGDSMMQSRINSPGTDEGLRVNAGIVSGVAQAYIETVFNTTGFKLVTGKIPTLGNLFNRMGMQSRVLRGGAGFVAGSGALLAGEYTEETLQGGTDLALQGLAQELSGLNPKIDFGGFFKGWLTVAGKEQRDTLQAIIPYALLGGGVASVKHFKAGHSFLKNRTMLRGLGLTEAEARPVLAAETPEAAQAAFQAGFEAAAERSATLTPEENARQEQHRRDAIETLRAQNEALAGAGLARVEKEHNDFTGEDQFIFIHPEDGSRKVFETEEAALDAFGDWSRSIEETNIETVQAAAHEEFLAHLTGEGMAGENVNVDVSAKTLTLPKVQAELEANVKAAEKDAQMAATAAQRRAAQERMDQAATSLAWLKERMKVMLFDMGLTPAQAGEAFKSTVILGRVFAQKAADRVLGYTVQLFHGHQVADIAEEFSEANMREALDAGFADPEILLDNIRRYEAATGAKVIAPEYQYDPYNPVPLLEGFSKLARGYMMSEVRSGALPDNLRKWIEMQTALTAATVDIARGFSGAMGTDLQTAEELREAIAAGYLPARLQQQLADAVGLDPKAQEARLQKKMEDQLAAEAMEGFPEIAETLQGQLPHPETLRANAHPLYGEVRRIWDALKKPTRRKTKQGRAVDRTNEANAFFLPVGQMEDMDDVRARANERGFAFDSITDMLDAMDASISYGKPFYGTGNGTDQGEASYSMTVAELDEKLFDKIGESALRVEQPRARYEDKRQLIFDFSQSIVGQPAVPVVGAAAGFRELQIIGQKFAEKLAIDLQVRFIGETLSDTESLVRKAQALRNPLFETFYLLGKDAAGKLKGAMAVTSRIPCSAAIFETGQDWSSGPDAHADFLRQCGATSYVLLHNHPSGDPSPSSHDIGATRRHAKEMGMRGFWFENHIVINHLTYTSIDAHGNRTSGELPEISDAGNIDPFAAKITDLGFTKALDSPSQILSAFAQVQANKGKPGVLTGFVTDVRFKVVGMVQGTLEQFRAVSTQELQEFALDQGGVFLLLAGVAESRAEAAATAVELLKLHNSNLLFEVVFEIPSLGEAFSAVDNDIFKRTLSNFRFFGANDKIATRVQEGETYSMGQAGRPLFSSAAVQALRHDKTAWQESGYGMDGAVEIVSKYYKTAAFAGIPKDAVLVPVPSTSGHNVLPIALGVRIAKDFGNTMETRPAGVALAKGEAKNKRTFFDKEADPVGFVPVPEVLADLAALGRPVYITEDVHNTGESWIAFAKMLQASGLEVVGVAALVSTEQRMTSARDIERLSEKVSVHLGKGIDEVLPAMQSLFAGTFKQLFNKAENDITNSKTKAAKLVEIATGGRREGAYSNPLPGGIESQRGSAGARGQRGLPSGEVNLFGETWSLSHGSVLRLEQAIANKMTQGPDERAEFYEKLRNRLAATILQLRESKRNLVVEPGEAERERNRIRDGLAEARAIIAAMPAEARGKVLFPINDILEAKSERGQVNALIRLIQEADDALESVLLKEYREAFETLLDLAKPDLRQNKQVRGRLTPDTQRLVGEVLTAAVMEPEAHAAALLQNEAAIAAMENQTPDTPEAATEMQRQLVELYQQQTILNTFGAFSRLDAAQTAHAYQQLQSIYVRGRTARKILDEARRQEINDAKAELLATLPEVSQHQHAERTADKGVGDQYQAFRLGMSSFHQVMEFLFPKSTTARDMQERVRKADRGFVRAKIAARERFDAFTFGAWGLSGVSRTRKRNAIVAELSTQRDTWGVQLLEGEGTTTEKLTEDQAAAILAGRMKTGWETDLMAMTSLGQALADFRMQRLKAQNEDKQFRSTVIRFQRVTKRGTPGPLLASDLQVVYFLQLWAQEQYRPALDKYGFTAEVMATLEKKLNPKAQDMADFLRDEYDAEWSRLNPVYRAIYGLDMPRIRNYAPGLFEHLDGKSATDSTIDPYGNAGGVNAMSAGFTKARTHHLARPRLTNAMAGYWSHFEATEYFIHYAEVCRDARQIFRNPELRRRIEGLHGLKAAKLFGQWLDALEVDGHFRAVEMDQLAEMTHMALATQSAVGLAFNVGVLFKQIPAAFGTLLEMPTKQAFVGIMRAISHPGTLRAVWTSEAVQQRVLNGIGPEDRRMLDAGRASPSMIMELLELGRLPIAYADAAFTTLSGSIAYNYHLGEALKAGMGQTQAEASALAAASRVIERTAQPATSQDKSMAEITAKSFTKFLFLFKSDPRQKLAIVANAVAEARKGTPGAKAALARKALWGWAIYGLCNEVLADIAQSLFRDDDDPERWNWRDYLAAMIVGPAQGIPMLGSAFDLAVRGTIGTKAYSNTINPVEAGMGHMFKQLPKLWEIATNDTDDHLSINDILTKAQQLTAAIALAAGGFDPRAAIVPALIRAARDAQGAAGNAWGAVTPESADDKALSIAKEFQKTEKTERDGKAEANATLAKELLKLPATERAAKLGKLDKDTRGAVTRKLKAASMTPAEAALARLPKDARTAAIEKITAGMEAAAKADYLDRLKALGLAH
jgi:orotate phosphoribosyltransferase